MSLLSGPEVTENQFKSVLHSSFLKSYCTNFKLSDTCYKVSFIFNIPAEIANYAQTKTTRA